MERDIDCVREADDNKVFERREVGVRDRSVREHQPWLRLHREPHVPVEYIVRILIIVFKNLELFYQRLNRIESNNDIQFQFRCGSSRLESIKVLDF